MNHRLPVAVVLAVAVPFVSFAAGEAEAGAGSQRGTYLAEQGYVIPPEEVVIESYIASVDYDYALPEEGPLGVYVYSGNRTVAPEGGIEYVHVGLKGQYRDFADLPPLNLAFVIDKSGSMGDENKMEWVKEAFELFIERVRPRDFVSLVVFDNEAQTIFPSTAVSDETVREKLRTLVSLIEPDGGTNLNAGLELGYLEVQKNYRPDYTNRVLFLTDGVGDSDQVLDLATTFREMDINVSTIGVGTGFDLDLMIELARAGGGSSRFIANREEMESIFSTDLDRMVVAAARDVEVEVTLSDGVRLDETWGYQHEVSEDGRVVIYHVPTLHNRDYETMLARVLYEPRAAGTESPLADVEVRFRDLEGEPTTMGPYPVVVTTGDAPRPLYGVSTYRVIKSVGMLGAAEALQEIGAAYAEATTIADEAERRSAVEAIIERNRLARAELEAARERLDGEGFEDEIAIFDTYFTTLGRETGLAEEEIVEVSEDRGLPVEEPERRIVDHLGNLFREVAEHLRNAVAIEQSVAVAPFYIRTGVMYPVEFNRGMRGYIQQTSTTELSMIDGIRLIDTAGIEQQLASMGFAFEDLRDTERAIELARSVGSDALVTGTIMEMAHSFVVFARVIDSAGGEVLAAAQVVMDKDIVLDDLLGPAAPAGEETEDDGASESDAGEA